MSQDASLVFDEFLAWEHDLHACGQSDDERSARRLTFTSPATRDDLANKQ